MGSRSLLAALLAAAFASLLPPPAAPSGHRKLLVFLLDGFRFDYIDDGELEGLPGFRDIVTMGVKVDYVTPDFPSLSYPNYYTLMTDCSCSSLGLCAGGYLKMASDLADVVCVEGARHQPNTWHPHGLPRFVCTDWVRHVEQATRCGICFFWPQLSKSWLSEGRHCEVHQMIGNYMWDQKTNLSFDIGVNKESMLPLWWNGSEPLWVTMMKEKKNVSMYYWPANLFPLIQVSEEKLALKFQFSPEILAKLAEDYCITTSIQGCEVEILGVRPSYCREYFSVPTDKNFADAISDALESLRNGSAEMAAVYYERIDVEGHHYGPSSQQRKNALKEVDKALSNMITLIKSMGLQHDVNVLLFSDHGMTDISWADKVIELKNYINMSDTIQMKDRGPVVSLWPAPEKHAEIYQKLKAVEHMHVYNIQDIPDRFFYKKGKFVSPLTLVAEKGWFIVESRDKLPFWENGTGRKEAWQNGWHGYDNELMDMRAFFIAYGPDFRSNFRAPPIRSVDIYNIMCSLAGIQPLPNNGSWSRVECMLRNTAPLAPLPPGGSCALALALLSLFARQISLL